jgi:hypothetical protein
MRTPMVIVPEKSNTDDTLLNLVVNSGGIISGNHLRAEMDEAEAKAWDSLSRYKFQMFGYWAAIWVHLNRIGGFKRPNPWKDLVQTAKRRGKDG